MVEYKNILFCTDFSDDANIAFVHALNLAKKYGASLHILHVPHSPFTYERDIVDEHVSPEKSTEGQAFYDEDVIRLAEKDLRTASEHRLGEVKNHVFVIKGGAPDVEIIRYVRSNDIDLIVMGALGKCELEQKGDGSTVSSVSKYAHCHVMAIKEPGQTVQSARQDAFIGPLMMLPKSRIPRAAGWIPLIQSIGMHDGIRVGLSSTAVRL